MKTNHTPGPWHVIPSREKSKFSTDWREIGAGRDQVVAAASFSRSCDGEHEEICGVYISEANARLIASAPDLLAALEVVAFDIKSIAKYAPHIEKACFENMEMRVRKAIAQAKGETK